jgi:hypothetical protein
VLAKTAGADRAEVRRQLLAELERRREAVPPEPFLSLRVDLLLARREPFGRARSVAQAGQALGVAALSGVRALRRLRAAASSAASQPEETDEEDGDERSEADFEAGIDKRASQRYARDKARTTKVELSETGRRVMAQTRPVGSFTLSGLSMINISLAAQGAISAVFVGDEIVGHLNDAATREFTDLLARAERHGTRLAASGLRRDDPEDGWKLYTYLPNGEGNQANRPG